MYSELFDERLQIVECSWGPDNATFAHMDHDIGHDRAEVAFVDAGDGGDALL
jgi:hypothetical protein